MSYIHRFNRNPGLMCHLPDDAIHQEECTLLISEIEASRCGCVLYCLKFISHQEWISTLQRVDEDPPVLVEITILFVPTSPVCSAVRITFSVFRLAYAG
jgi:hypothetical protein